MSSGRGLVHRVVLCWDGMDYIPSRVFHLLTCLEGACCECAHIANTQNREWYYAQKARERLQHAYWTLPDSCMKCAYVEHRPSKEAYNLFLIQEGMNTNLDTKGTQIREQKKYNTQIPIMGSSWCRFHSFQVNFRADRSGLGWLLIKKEGWLNGCTGVISPLPARSSSAGGDKWSIISPNGSASSEHKSIIDAHGGWARSRL